MTSPMTNPDGHDTLVLLDGSKRWVVPGVARVAVTLGANLDVQTVPADGDAVTQLNEGTTEVEVEVTMWTAEQWDQYQHLLGHLRRGTKEGTAVFTSAHPEIRARGTKRLYFVEERGEAYSPRVGYRAKLRFREKLKDTTKATALGDDSIVIPPAPGRGGATASTPQGQAVYEAAVRAMGSPPAPADGGRATTATPGMCSASIRVVGTAAGLPASLYGASAIATEGNFKRAGLSQPWGPDSMANLQLGDHVFFSDPSGYGHVGIVVGRDKDGMPLIYGNNGATYTQKGGRYDGAGRPVDRHIDARGTVRLNQLTGPRNQPTSVGKPGGVPKTTKPRIVGPPVPLPSPRPSQNVPLPPGR